MKNKLSKVILILAVMLIFLPFANAVGVTVSPSMLDFNIELGETGQGSIFVINYDEETTNYEIYAEDYKDWITFSPTSVSVEGGKNKLVKVSVEPDEIGEFETTIYVRLVPKESEEGGASVGVAPGVGIKTKIIVREEPKAYCGDGICNAGETCSTCPTDCGTCSTNDGGNTDGGNTGGGSSGGGSSTKTNQTASTGTSSTTQTTTTTSTSTDNNETENPPETSTENQQKGFFSGITGAVTGTLGTAGTIGAFIFVIIIIAVAISIAVMRRKRETTEKL